MAQTTEIDSRPKTSENQKAADSPGQDASKKLSDDALNTVRSLYQKAHEKSAETSDGHVVDLKEVVQGSGSGIALGEGKLLALSSNPALKDLPLVHFTPDGSIDFSVNSHNKNVEQMGHAATGHDGTGTLEEVKPGVQTDTKGNVTEVDYANGTSRKFGYDDAGKLNRITDVDGKTATLVDGKWTYEQQHQDPKNPGSADHGPVGGESPGSQGSRGEAGTHTDQSSSKNGESAKDSSNDAAGIGRLLAGLGSADAGPDYVNPKVSADGTFSYDTNDGKQHAIAPDGSGLITNPADKSVIKTDVDNNVTAVTYENGQSRQIQYSKDIFGASHISGYTDTDGKSYTLTDGKWLDSSGKDSGLTNVGVGSDGSFTSTSKEGQTTTVHTDRSLTVTNPNDSVKEEDANGQIKQIKYSNGTTTKFGYDGNTLNSVTGTDGKTITLGADGKWKDQNGNDTGIHNVSQQPDGSYTFADKDNHLVINDTSGQPQRTDLTIDQIQQSARDIHDAENNKFLWVFNNADGGKVNDIIKNMSPTDRYVLEQQYQAQYGKKLTDDISSTLNSNDAAKANEMLYVANVQELANKNIPDAPGADGKNQRQTFLDNMNGFVERAHARGMSDQEIAGTFAATQNLLEATDGKTSEQLREELAQQIMAEAAHPDHTDQGGHLTCNVTDVETRTWFNNPSKMAGMISEIALTGSYTATDGKHIDIPPQNLIPDGEARNNPPIDGQRSFASQLAQAGMANDVGQRETPPKYYTQLPPTADATSGEFWTDKSGNPLLDDKGKPIAFGGIGYGDIGKEAQRLSGQDFTTFLNSELGGGDNLVGFKDQNELRDQLVDAKNHGKMPIIIGVTADDPLFGGNKMPGDKDRHGGDHVVCIDDYNPDTGMVRIDNSWGSGNDKWVPLSDLYRSTQK